MECIIGLHVQAQVHYKVISVLVTRSRGMGPWGRMIKDGGQSVSSILNDVLCFLRCKFGKIAIKPLKSSVLDFFKVEDLRDAKSQLLQDIQSLNLVASKLSELLMISLRY